MDGINMHKVIICSLKIEKCFAQDKDLVVKGANVKSGTANRTRTKGNKVPS